MQFAGGSCAGIVRRGLQHTVVRSPRTRSVGTQAEAGGAKIRSEVRPALPKRCWLGADVVGGVNSRALTCTWVRLAAISLHGTWILAPSTAEDRAKHPAALALAL